MKKWEKGLPKEIKSREKYWDSGRQQQERMLALDDVELDNRQDLHEPWLDTQFWQDKRGRLYRK